MPNIQFSSIWTAQKQPHSAVGFHEHNYYELVYYRHGGGKTVIGGQTYVFENNSFAVIPPHIRHNEYHDFAGEVICLGFGGSFDATDRLYQDSLGHIARILESLLKEAKEQTYGYQEMIAAKLNELCLLILRSEKTSGDEKNLAYIVNYLKENYHEKILLSQCAKQLNISYDYFQHKFKAVTGLSPRQFLIEQRLNASEKLLLSDDLSCTEIAYQCGFSTSAQYSALFKRKYGKTPMEFRKQHQ